MTNKIKSMLFFCAVFWSVAQAQAGWFDSKPAAPLRAGYTCCNLHYEDDWISDSNFGSLPFIPAGTPVRLTSYGSNRLYVDMNGKDMRIGLDYGRAQETLEQFAEKLIVADDPKAKIAQYPATVREAIKLGQVAVGMSKEQAVIAVGYPQRDETLSLDAPVWNYWASSFSPYRVMWNKNGQIAEIVTDPVTASRMVYRKQK
ncbi:MAG TPA: hypothetical protein PLE48_04785 [Thiobacillus sp.]|nr:MAG: hypothetical protein B7Y50_12485 [Hydrogenophilales bacterium 28-61-11]OYZ58491.1 MAG: hypothetical protein B7Y21_03230 [Hydrogenophilales bacterium 16-61-112]OZA44188.1 MAG: hypothetical protein B7X81_10280 [Hydrogenophilales bacterium 17-61-76]HQT31844.1 hypothetical protein [Thiobacillus sp.]HQT69720.1 hypothetical protein [Thiobacillus sp.]